MFQRQIKSVLEEMVASFPITLLTGPRQSGKTTLLQIVFKAFDYITLESPDNLLRVKNDPRGFLAHVKHGIIIDEAQNYPELFSYIQEIVDKPGNKKKFILSGSQNFLLSEKISQTLAGRTGILELLPLDYEEFKSYPGKSSTLWDLLYNGLYPKPYHESIRTELWFQSYIRTYLERDVRSIVNIKDLSKFQMFLKLCAGRHGQLLNQNTLSDDCGISHTTASSWLSILEASYIIFKLQPHFNNFNKRLVKSPKLYFYDPAIVCHLLGINSPEDLQLHASRGAIFEGFILSEIVKHYLSLGKTPPLYFWRDRSGVEIDGLIDAGNKFKAIEIKSGLTITPSAFKNLQRFQKYSNIPSKNCFVVYAGEDNYKSEGYRIVSWENMSSLYQ